jgi:hypothetical protein
MLSNAHNFTISLTKSPRKVSDAPRIFGCGSEQTCLQAASSPTVFSFLFSISAFVQAVGVNCTLELGPAGFQSPSPNRT